MRVVTEQDGISLEEIRRMAATRFGDLVKAVIDVERRMMIVDAELHADEEADFWRADPDRRIFGGSISTRTWRRVNGSSSTP
jgi:hypothetical protein